jgi:hypothetical protein
VLQAIAHAHELSWDQVLKVADLKRAAHGGFHDRVFLESVELRD